MGSMRTSKKWDYIAHKDDTAQSIVNLILRQRHADVKAGYKRVGYIVREFKDTFSPEVGGNLPNSYFALSPVTVDKIVEQLATKNLKTYTAVCNHLRDKIGVPYIVRPTIQKDSPRRIRSVEEIRCRLDKLQKKLTRETKELTLLCALTAPPISSRIVGAHDVMHWIYNGGKLRAWDAILNKLYELKIEQERDRLFHVRRHESDRNMNNCFNEEINGAIVEVNWVLVDNPFDGARMSRLSATTVPFQNQTVVEHDE